MGRENHGGSSPRKFIDKYFLEQENPYSRRRPIRTKWVLGTASVVLLFFIVGVFYFGGRKDEDRGRDRNASPDFKTLPSTAASQSNDSLAVGQAQSGRDSHTGRRSKGLYNSVGRAATRAAHAHSANQVIRRGENGTSSALPLGSTIPVRLINTILSTDSNTPVIAEVTDDVYVQNTLLIPASTRAIGTAQFDMASQRIQLRFQTLVYPEGEQHGIAAIGLMPDGSAGLEGDYHSGAAKHQVGQFLGNFISAMADGMKERKLAGELGISYEPGSIKNGLLNGVTQSAQDQAKSYTNELNQAKPTMTLLSGQSFVLFLEHEYSE